MIDDDFEMSIYTGELFDAVVVYCAWNWKKTQRTPTVVHLNGGVV